MTRTLTARLRSRARTLPQRACAVAVAAVSAVGAPVVLTAGGGEAPTPVAASAETIPLRGVDRAALADAPSIPAAERASAAGSASAGTRFEQVGDRDLSRTVAATDERATEPFRVVGVSWRGHRDDLAVFVRTRSESGWGRWEALTTDADHGPDPDSAEGARARGGTDPLIVDESTAVQVRVDDLPGGGVGAPAGMRLSLIDPKDVPADDDAGRVPTAPSLGSAQAAAARPTALTRAQWGADESIRRGEPEYGTIRAGFVHHTVNSNGYAKDDVPALIRGIYRFHVLDRGWNDIGYNFLVDRFGRIWEGRYGGVTQPVIGAHTHGYNSQSFAMASIGDHTTSSPSNATLLAYKRLYAWKLGLHHVDPAGRVAMSDGAATRWSSTISGHRDANQTGCPGAALQRRLPEIRSGARYRQKAMFWTPSLTASRWTYGTLGPRLNAKVQGYIRYRLEVTHPCGGLVRYTSGYASAANPIRTGWTGRLFDGSWAPPGYYTLRLTAVDRTGKSPAPAAWTRRVWVRSTPTSPPSFCEQQ